MNLRSSYTFTRFFRTYFLIFIIVSLIFLLTNISSIVNVQRTLKDAYKTSIDQISSSLDANMTEMQKLAEIISRDNVLTAYNINNYIDLPHKITSEMEKLKTSFSMLSSVGLVYRNSQYSEVNNVIYTDSGRFTLENYSSIICDNQIDPFKLENLITSVGSPVFHVLDNPEQELLLILPLPVQYVYSPAVLLYKVDMKYLLQSSPATNSNVYITDISGQLMGYKGFLFNGLKPASKFFLGEEFYKKNIVFDTISNIYGLKVYMTINKNDFNRPLYNSIFGFLCLIVFVTASGLYISYILAKNSFRPIYTLFTKIGRLNELPVSKKKNELELIDRTFDQLCEERDRYADEVLEDRIIVRDHLLLSIINGNNPVIKNEYVRNFWNGLNSDGNSFCVVVALIDNYPQLIKTHSAREQWVMKYSLCSDFEACCINFGSGYAISSAMNSGIIGIIHCKADKNAGVEAFSACQQLRQAVKSNFGLTITCTIGAPVQEISAVCQSYKQAEQAARYRFFLGRDTIITSELAAQFEASRKHSPESLRPLIDNLLQRIKAGSPDDIGPAVQRVFADINNEKQIAVFNIAFFDILSAVNKLIQEGLRDKKDTFFSKLEILYENQFETIADATDTLVYFCIELSNYFAAVINKSDSKDIYPLIIEYITENYKDPNLNLSMIADKMSLNPSYLTRFFKTRSGIPLMQYIDQYRFDKSKELLIQTDLTIKKVVETVGYFDETNFMHKFKKIEGISPSQFRNIYKQQLKY